MMVAACSAGAGGSSGPPISGGDFHVGWNAQPSTLDPVATTPTTTPDIRSHNFPRPPAPVATPATTTRDIGSNIFEGLAALDANFQPQPVLAQSFKVSSDYTKFDFTLRTDVTFHNGQKMTVDDVIASVKRWISDAVTGKQFFSGSQVTSPSAGVVQIATQKPLFTGMLLLADASQPLVVMPASAIAKKGASGVQDIVGTGPYKLAEGKKGQYIRLEKYVG